MPRCNYSQLPRYTDRMWTFPGLHWPLNWFPNFTSASTISLTIGHRDLHFNVRSIKGLRCVILLVTPPTLLRIAYEHFFSILCQQFLKYSQGISKCNRYKFTYNSFVVFSLVTTENLLKFNQNLFTCSIRLLFTNQIVLKKYSTNNYHVTKSAAKKTGDG